jgi:hypothetical protein
LQSAGRPLWVTDKFLSLVYWSEYQRRYVFFQYKAAPEHALMPIETSQAMLQLE